MSAIMSTIESVAGAVTQKGKALMDSIIPPEQRSELLAKLQQFAVRNPKLSAFLLTNIALTGPPLFLFILFTLTVFVFSLVVALLVGLLVAVGFTLFALVVALLILFPTIFFTTLAACFLFLWGVGGFYLVKWFNKGETPAIEGSAIGDKLNSLTGGRLDSIMGPMRKNKPEQQSIKEDGESTGQKNGEVNRGQQQNGTPAKIKNNKHRDSQSKASGFDMGKNADMVKKNANLNNLNNSQANLDSVTKGTGLDGVKTKADTTTGTVKGVAGGATGGVPGGLPGGLV